MVKERVDLQSLPSVNIDGIKYSATEALRAINYGNARLFSSLASIASKEPLGDVGQLFRLWDVSLLKDLSQTLFSFNETTPSTCYAVSIEYDGLYYVHRDPRSSLEAFMLAEDVRLLLECLSAFREAYVGRYYSFPQSYVLQELRIFVNHLREHVGQDQADDLSALSRMLKTYWSDVYSRLGNIYHSHDAD
jgi:hypothetical protein